MLQAVNGTIKRPQFTFPKEQIFPSLHVNKLLLPAAAWMMMQLAEL
jgi:hypothetical protein